MFHGKVTSLISGGLGPVVVCHIKAANRTYLRSQPSPYKQTRCTIAAQSAFALASAAGKILRGGLRNALPFPKDKMMQVTFTGAINKWLKTNPVEGLQPHDEVTGLDNFALNSACAFERRWKDSMQIIKISQNALLLKMPALRRQKTFPPQLTQCWWNAGSLQ